MSRSRSPFDLASDLWYVARDASDWGKYMDCKPPHDIQYMLNLWSRTIHRDCCGVHSVMTKLNCFFNEGKPLRTPLQRKRGKQWNRRNPFPDINAPFPKIKSMEAI